MPTFSSLVPGPILIHKTTLLTKIYNSSLYHMDECTCREDSTLQKRPPCPEPFKITWTTRISVSAQTFKYWWGPQASLEWGRRAEQPVKPYSSLQALKMDYHTDEKVVSWNPLALHTAPEVTAGAAVTGRWLEAQATTCQQRLFFCILSVVR